MHQFTDDFKTELAKWQNKPVEMFRIYLQDGTLYLTNYPIQVKFFDENGNEKTYSSLAIQRGKIKRHVESRTDEMDISLDNINLQMSALFGTYNLKGIRVQVIKAMRRPPVPISEDFSIGTLNNLEVL
jgi:hypothetical protein